MSTFQENLKDSMRAATLSIHGGMSYDSVLLASGHELQTVRIVAYAVLRETLHEDTVNFALMDV
jgi:hypothetical protein